MDRYNCNRIYITQDDQEKIKETRILIAGAEIGSVIAECALRIGFDDIVIADGGKVEECNLNAHNYTKADIGKFKAERLAKRLLRINPSANIQFHNIDPDNDNIIGLLKDVKIAINTIPFSNDIAFVFDQLCSQKRIPVLHPYNFGWGAFLTIVKPGGYQLTEIASSNEGFDITLADYVSRYSAFWDMPNRWLNQIIDTYRQEDMQCQLPQLSVASWVLAGHCVNVLFDIVTGKEVKFFPKFYFSSLRCDPA